MAVEHNILSLLDIHICECGLLYHWETLKDSQLDFGRGQKYSCPACRAKIKEQDNKM